MTTIGPSYSLPEPGTPPFPLTDSGSLKRMDSEEKLSSSLSDSWDMDDFADFIVIDKESISVNPEPSWLTSTVEKIFSKNVETPVPTPEPAKPEIKAEVKPQWSLSASISSLFFRKIEGDETNAPLFSKIQTLFRLELPLEPKLKDALNAFLKECSEEKANLERFFDICQAVKDDSISLLKKDNGELPLLASSKVQEMFGLFTLLQPVVSMSNLDEKNKTLVLSILESGLNRANYNNQVHTDLINWGVETDPNFFVGGGPRRTYEYIQGIETRIEALEEEVKNPQTPNIDKKQRQLNKLKEMKETEYVPRNASRGIQQFQKWEEVMKNPSGGFVKGFRRIGFKSKSGGRDVAVPLDLSFLPNTMTREQSKGVFELMLQMDVNQEKPDMITFLKERNSQGGIIQTPLPAPCQEKLDKLDFLDSTQKKQLVNELAVFTYRLMRDSQLIYLNT